MSWQDAICQSVGPASITNVNSYVAVSTTPATAPIDRFYASTQDLLKIGTPSMLTQHPPLGPLLLVWFVSLTENYFRDILAAIVRICPVARSSAADQMVKLGSVIWHGASLDRAAFEHISLADAKVLVATIKKFLGYDLKQASALEQFDKVCELRHTIVHASGVMAGQNAIRLQIPSSADPLYVRVGFAELQEAAAICTSLVVSTNRELFIELARRWAKRWPFLADWVPSDSHERFKLIWNIFRSQIDAGNGTISAPMTLIRCRNAISKHTF